MMSRPARGAWIETIAEVQVRKTVQSRPARGAWIETSAAPSPNPAKRSRPARGAWIETHIRATGAQNEGVAPRAGRVD